MKAPVDARGNQDAPPGSSIPRSAPQATSPSRSMSARRAAAGGNATHYVVKRGDTLYSIAWQHGLSYQQLAAGNGIRYPYTIYTGQRLSLKPAGTPARAKAASPRPLPRAVPAQTATRPPVQHADTAAAQPPPGAGVLSYDGNWVWPTRGRLLRSFQSSGRGRKGIDIGGHDGQPVKAAASGKVVYVGSGLVGYGKLIIIKHNENLLSAYGHNSKLLVAEGEHVRAGQQIAEMGSSGTNRTGLYFEIRQDGKPVNPLRYLPKS